MEPGTPFRASIESLAIYLRYIYLDSCDLGQSNSIKPVVSPASWPSGRRRPGPRCAAGPAAMDAPPPLRQPRAPVVPTGIPHGVDAVVGAIRSGRPTRQVPQRSGHAPQPPRCSTGGGTPPAGRVDAQRPLVGLMEGVRRPPWPIQATARVGAPVHAMGDPHDRASRPRLGVTTHARRTGPRPRPGTRRRRPPRHRGPGSGWPLRLTPWPGPWCSDTAHAVPGAAGSWRHPGSTC